MVNIEDIKKMNIAELSLLARDIRRFLVKTVAKTGGHLSSNLGTVELTIALHYVFESPKDKIIWDVGHQAYTHKILTGRTKQFSTLRQEGGLSGFLKRGESEHDIFETGHSSTSISASLGIAVARDLKGEQGHAVAVIGDGALTGGMAFEALNHAGRTSTNIIVILNDNEMSISPNVGGMSKYLTKLRAKKEYAQAKRNIASALTQIPKIGKTVLHTARRTKDSIKSFLMEDTLFDEMGFTYLGPVDGHNISDLTNILESAKKLSGPLLIHVKTIKGKGYLPAKNNPGLYHGVPPFDPKVGIIQKTTPTITFSRAFGEAMEDIGSENKKVIAISAAMIDGTGLTGFSQKFPRRCFDVGIAEQHAVTFAAGLAIDGFIPVVAVYSSFLQRAYDQILHDVALQNLPVIFAIDRAGLVGEDGATHQGIFDMAYLSHIPNMQILCPKTPNEIDSALRYATTRKNPVAIRYPKGNIETNLAQAEYTKQSVPPIVHYDYSESEIAILATGRAVSWADEVCAYLKETYDVQSSLIEVPQIMPFDTKGINELITNYSQIITIEDHVITGGFGSIVKMNCNHPNILCFGFKQGIVEHGGIEKLLEKNCLTPSQIGDTIIQRGAI
ncbi:MAG: 1-deoxy-D-xylulose-5-phosphate synthase [Epulopiscium sp. Nele67-Bin004]|nr:MAG: 1-deoxy-D-xylulose-5-phosphate synthase [Epulopiscium sp. Nele67-Bin004]